MDIWSITRAVGEFNYELKFGGVGVELNHFRVKTNPAGI